MTSKKSFWARFIRNNSQKVWMWIICFLTMLMLYPSIMLVYFNRISGMYSDDSPLTRRILDYNMNLAVCEAIGARDNIIFGILAFVIAFGIFGYVNYRSKVDVFKAIPVSSKKSFFSDFGTGIVIVFVNYVFAIICTMILAAGWGYLPVAAIKQCIFMTVVNLMMFVFYYSIAIICVMITGNIFVAFGAGFVISFSIDMLASQLNTYKFLFFKTADNMFGYGNVRFSPLVSFNEKYCDIEKLSDIGEMIKVLEPTLIHLVIGCAVLIPLAYISFKKRPAEAMNKALYVRPVAIIIKVVTATYSAIVVGEVIYNSSSESTSLMILSAVVCATLVGMAFDVLYSFDIKALLKSWWSTIIGIAVSLLILGTFIFDFTGYDDYLPSNNDVESYAVNIYSNGYGELFRFVMSDYEQQESCSWVDNSEYYLENMYITDIDSISRLAKIAQDNGQYYNVPGNWIELSVHYRRKGLWDTDRRIRVNPYDEESVALLDNIIGSKEWRDGFFQFNKEREVFLDRPMKIFYSNGVTQVKAGVDMGELLDAYALDSEKFTYSKGFNEEPCGKIIIYPSEYWVYALPVYEDYSNTLNLFKEDDSFIENKFTSEYVTGIKITNYHNEIWENGESYDYPDGDSTVTITIDDPEKIDEILSMSSPSELTNFWGIYDDARNNYNINVYFVDGYEMESYADYMNFSFTEEVPQWVIEQTALG